VKTWFKTGFISHGVLNLTPGECHDICKRGAIIIDVREDYLRTFKMFRVKRLFHLPYSRIEQLYNDLPVDIPLIFADTVGLKSREAVLFMNDRGFTNVANMAGGIVDWERDGLPVSSDLSARLTGSCMCQLKPGKKSGPQAAGGRNKGKGRSISKNF
jgi:rhodanese-related sulfurtransferase